jgi:hydrogenase maturation protein HypF
MDSFPLCPQCQAEYEDPNDRRFHAQTIACQACGPRVTLRDRQGAALEVANPIATFVDAIRQGQIGALKGLGGYHLCCDATQAAAVQQLRMRKQRDEKPFAIMVASLETAAAICELSDAENVALCSPIAPIVLLRRRPTASDHNIADSVAPGNPVLGIFLPYTPLHLLLMAAVRKPLVMTSGNRSDEPIACDDQDAIDRLSPIADVFLTHDRPIHVRCDDSVMRMSEGKQTPIRRARGLAPAPLRLPVACPEPILAVGGQLKGTFSLGCDRQAFVSHHLGDLDHLSAYRAFVRDVELYRAMFAIEPKCAAHDLHPDYASTRYARDTGLPMIPVQHHHTHLASCMAEHELDEPVIGVVFDGAGLGTDGAIWGGEFLLGDYAGFQRLAHLCYTAMPGGDVAAREPWRMAVSHLLSAGGSDEMISALATAAAIRAARTMIERQINSPPTSSMGRLFDAVAAISGLRLKSNYEGQAAMELEWQALRANNSRAYSWELIPPASSSQSPEIPGWIINPAPLIREAAEDKLRGVSTAIIARKFHSAVVELVAEVCHRIRSSQGVEKVVISGGVFMNTVLAREVPVMLSEHGFEVFSHEQVPPNDGGLSLGQLAIAARRLMAVATR